MPLYRVYSHPINRHYRASACSSAIVFQCITIIITIIAPLLIAFATQGFWIKTNTYREQPSINYLHKYLFILRSNNDNYIVWSSYATLNQFEVDHLRIPIIESTETDTNHDGRPDRLSMNVRFNTIDQPIINSIFWLLIFDYRLDLRSRFQMQTAIYGEHQQSTLLSSQININGDIKFHQRILLNDRGIDRRFDYPIINSSSINVNDYQLDTILSRYFERNFTTILDPFLVTWNTFNQQQFVINIAINYVEDTYRYATGIGELIKWAWIQYASILIVVVLIMRKIRKFVFINRLVITIDGQNEQ